MHQNSFPEHNVHCILQKTFHWLVYLKKKTLENKFYVLKNTDLHTYLANKSILKFLDLKNVHKSEYLKKLHA